MQIDLYEAMESCYSPKYKELILKLKDKLNNLNKVIHFLFIIKDITMRKI